MEISYLVSVSMQCLIKSRIYKVRDNVNFFLSGKLTKSESVSSECSFQNRKCLSPKRNLYYILAAISTIVVVMITTSVIFSRDIPIDNDLEEDDNLTSIGNHSLIYRNQWDGRPPLFRNTLRFPVKYVIISHTEWPTCNNLDVCSHFMRAIQSYHMEVNGSEPDIGFNFVVGGDGNIYVGRGWHTTNFHMNSSIGISFMGNFEINELTDVMIDAALSLISYGEENKIFSSRYRIVGHNQTYPTESPGENVYRIIKNWDHFVNATVHHS